MALKFETTKLIEGKLIKKSTRLTAFLIKTYFTLAYRNNTHTHAKLYMNEDSEEEGRKSKKNLYTKH